jgi:hypothetical protein
LLFESLFESFPIGFIHYNNLILNWSAQYFPNVICS